MREIGSFIELEFPKGKEWFKGDEDIARLNTGSDAIWHAFRLTGAKAIWIPFYQCESVREFLTQKQCTIKYYHQDRNFDPIDLYPKDDEAVLFVNYFGIMSNERMKALSSSFHHVIIDNSQAFFCQPMPNAYNVYSARKFIGVPDGAYVKGNKANLYVEEYPQCYSSDTASFLLMRIEYGCEGKGYEARCVNENRVDTEDIMKMSVLTRTILDGTDYEYNIVKRKKNFKVACNLFSDINELNPSRFVDEETVPMVYPLLVEDDTILERLIAAKHFQGHWWHYLTEEMPEDYFEYWLSRYMVPITIDQRYSTKDLEYLRYIIDAK